MNLTQVTGEHALLTTEQENELERRRLLDFNALTDNRGMNVNWQLSVIQGVAENDARGSARITALRYLEDLRQSYVFGGAKGAQSVTFRKSVTMPSSALATAIRAGAAATRKAEDAVRPEEPQPPDSIVEEWKQKMGSS